MATMKRRVIVSKDVPAAFGPYSQGVVCGQTLYLSGVLGIDPQSGELRTGLEAQVEQLFDNMAATVAAAGGTLADIAKVMVILTDIAQAPVVNDAMARRFQPPYPARATIVAAALPKGALVEVDSVAVLAAASDGGG